MRYATVALPALAAILGLSSAAAAQPIEKRVRIDSVRVGFPVANPPGNRYRTGAWAPVYVDLTVGPRGFAKGEALLVVETTDSDDTQNRYVQELPVVPPKEGAETQLYGLISYVRPGNAGSEIHVSVRIGNQSAKVKYNREAGDDVLSSDAVVFLTAGSSLKSLWDVVEAEDRKNQDLGERRRRTPSVDQARQL
ncbi:MAG TPA: hypothetical protein VFA26_15235, partial [Gemmataceae bacterium]|nr:hypothetical protein [Gemmataceae bacterium]